MKVIYPDIFPDKRGYFTKVYSQKELDFVCVEENHSFSLNKGTLRGLHFQNSPHAQAKIVRCVKGAILDVIVDLRKYSPTYMKWISSELSETNKRQLYIPKGFAHGFITLQDGTEIEYKVDDYYDKELERTVRWNDKLLGINWGVENPVLSDRDENAPLFKDCDINL